MKRTLFFCGCALLCIFLVGREIFLGGADLLQLHLFAIGQGDAILLVTPSGDQIVVDGGPNLQLLEHLGDTIPFTDRSIELLILTHPDADHLTALPELLRRYRVEHILLSGIPHNSSRYTAVLNEISPETQVLLPDPEFDFEFSDGVTLDVVWPTPEALTRSDFESNDTSVVLRVLYKNQSILLTGDAEAPAEAAILASGANIRSTILKVGHHGSRTSSSTGFLLAVQPELALISAGKDNSFGHPHPEILERFATLGIPVRSTVEEGTISLLLDGENLPKQPSVEQ